MTLHWCFFCWEMATLNYNHFNKIEKRAEKWTLYCIKVWNNREILLLPFHTNNEEKIQTISTQNYRQLLLDGNTSTIFTFHLRVVKQFMTIILKVKSTRIKCYFIDLLSYKDCKKPLFQIYGEILRLLERRIDIIHYITDWYAMKSNAFGYS